MRTITSKGIIIKETNSGEADKFITVLLKDYGKMSIYCKGARNTKSKFVSATSIFSYCEFVIFIGSKTPTLASIDLVNNFYDIRLDYDKLVICSYFIEMCNKLILTDENCDDFIRLLYVAFKNIVKTDSNANLIKVVFEFKFLYILGIYPANSFCGTCNKMYDEFTGKIFFDINGLLCYNCGQNSKQKHIGIDDSIVYVINFILNTHISRVFNFTISAHTLNKLESCSTLFINGNINEQFKSIDYMLGK